ncbi:hypothetical protein ACS0TY_014667 [Phlomoides rotata]
MEYIGSKLHFSSTNFEPFLEDATSSRVRQSRTNPASVTWKGGAVLGIHDFKNHGYIARTGSGTGFILVVIESIKIFIFFKHKLCVTGTPRIHPHVYEWRNEKFIERQNWYSNFKE